jgi:tRNA threonylcarbamoyl adenosine modification protein (Sua5/YciO/YrdC/YwlC family)
MIQIFPGNINSRHLEKAVGILKSDGVVIIPTDTVYALACSLKSRKAFERICEIKNIKPAHANFSIVFSDFRHLSEYAKPFSREVFRMMKSNLPGPFTFILNAASTVPEIFKSKKKTIGVRIPDQEIVHAIIKELGNPLVVSSLHSESEISDYYSDAEEIESAYADKVDLIIDGGYSEMKPSTVVDCTGDEPVVVRDGKGLLNTE